MDPERLLEAHRYLDGELSPSEIERFEDLMKSDPELSLYVDQLRDMGHSLNDLEILSAPEVKIPGSFTSEVARLWDMTWRVKAVPAAAVILLFAVVMGRAYLPATPVVPEIRTESVRLVYFSPEASSVSVVGSFNGWQEEVQLHPRDNTGYWVNSIDVPPGEYRYAFLIDGEVRIADPTANSFMEDDYGSRNSVVRVGI